MILNVSSTAPLPARAQVHYFTSPEPGKMYVKINWRVPRANGQFYERSDLQRFVQDPALPAALYNHGNEVLHYQDDWRARPRTPHGHPPIAPVSRCAALCRDATRCRPRGRRYVLAFKPDAYALIYYRGSNDAWDGTGYDLRTIPVYARNHHRGDRPAGRRQS